MNEGINLLDPNKKSVTIVPVHRMETMRFIVMGLLFIVSVSSVILFILVAISPLPELQKQEQTLRQRLAQSKTDMAKLALVNERTSAIDSVLTKRLSLDQTIALIQTKLAKGATITAIHADDKIVTLTVESSSLQSLDNFLNGIIGFVQDKKSFSQVILTDLTSDATTGVYSVTVNLVLL